MFKNTNLLNYSFHIVDLFKPWNILLKIKYFQIIVTYHYTNYQY